MIRITVSTPAAEVILQHPRTLNVFERLHIPLGLHEKTLGQIAQEHAISAHLLLALLHITLHGTPPSPAQLEENDALTLVEYLLKSHEFYSQEASPRIMSLIQNAAIQGNNQNMALVEQFFHKYTQEIELHFDYEMRTAFPYIQQLFTQKNEKPQSQYCVKEYQQHHSNIEAKLTDLQNLLVKYLPQEEPYPIRRTLIQEITTLGNDLAIHTTIENEILIPLVEQKEKQWTS